MAKAISETCLLAHCLTCDIRSETLLCHSLEREEAEDLIKRHGGRVTGSVSKKTVCPFCLYLFFFLFSLMRKRKYINHRRRKLIDTKCLAQKHISQILLWHNYLSSSSLSCVFGKCSTMPVGM